jgi:hypothetical protein
MQDANNADDSYDGYACDLLHLEALVIHLRLLSTKTSAGAQGSAAPAVAPSLETTMAIYCIILILFMNLISILVIIIIIDHEIDIYITLWLDHASFFN